jgi:hypothetical protein
MYIQKFPRSQTSQPKKSMTRGFRWEDTRVQPHQKNSPCSGKELHWSALSMALRWTLGDSSSGARHSNRSWKGREHTETFSTKLGKTKQPPQMSSTGDTRRPALPEEPTLPTTEALA